MTPAGNGDPAIGESAPLIASMVNAEMVLPNALVTYKKLSDGSTVTDIGPLPHGNGEPGVGANAPEMGSTAKAATLFERKFAEYRNLRDTVRPSPSGPEAELRTV